MSAGEVVVNAGQGQVREEYRHEKCGGLVVALPGEKRFGGEEDCPICQEVKLTNERYGVKRATFGTRLAEEIGQVFEVGEVGPQK